MLFIGCPRFCEDVLVVPVQKFMVTLVFNGKGGKCSDGRSEARRTR